MKNQSQKDSRRRRFVYVTCVKRIDCWNCFWNIGIRYRVRRRELWACPESTSSPWGTMCPRYDPSTPSASLSWILSRSTSFRSLRFSIANFSSSLGYFESHCAFRDRPTLGPWCLWLLWVLKGVNKWDERV